MRVRRVVVPVLLLTSGFVSAAEPPPALRVRLVEPERQWERILGLFRDAPAPHPAAALAAWKRATRGTGRLSKSLEALIAAFNPAMGREIETLRDAELVLRFEDRGRLEWSAALPHDDGTFAALATAAVLTGGRREPDLSGCAVDRLGPAGAPLMASGPRALVLAGSRAALRRALADGHPEAVPTVTPAGVLRFVLDPAGLDRGGPQAVRRIAEGLRGLGCEALDGAAALDDETLTIRLTGRLAAPSPDTGRIDPRWLDLVPAEGVLGAVAVAVGPDARSIDRALAVADRALRADLETRGTAAAPLRVRLDALALVAGTNLETDLWPRLRGVSGFATADPDGLLVALHAADPAAAERIARKVLPRLIGAVAGRPASRNGPAQDPDAVVALGELAGRPVRMAQRGSSVLIGWGEGTLAASLDALDHPARSAGSAFRASWGPDAPHRAGAVWPGRIPAVATAPLPLRSALEPAAPIVWWGHHRDRTSSDTIRWTGLRGVVERFLARVPLELPAD